MPRHPESTESAIRSYVNEMERKGGYSPLSLLAARKTSRIAFGIIEKFQEGATPKTVTAETLRKTLEWMRENYTVSTQKIYFFYIKELMKVAGNRAYDDIRIVYPTDIRPNVDWLSLDDAMRLMRLELPSLEKIIIILGLCHGLRRAEMCNLRISDIHENEQYITVLGKGTGGGKFRSVSFHPIFHTVFLRWMETRSVLAHQCRDDVSQNALLVYIRGGKLRGYKPSSITHIVKALSKSMGMDFSPHTLRRTFGREMYHSGVRIETIAKIMGHSSTEMTLRYIGISLEDQREAMSQFILR